jgi:hypothetical protein
MLAHFLPERRQEIRNTGRSTCVQKADAEDFSCLLRIGGKTKR